MFTLYLLFRAITWTIYAMIWCMAACLYALLWGITRTVELIYGMLDTDIDN